MGAGPSDSAPSARVGEDPGSIAPNGNLDQRWLDAAPAERKFHCGGAPELTDLFEDITRCAGVSAPRSPVPDYYVTGQAFGDFDGDGWLDLYVTDSAGPNRLYKNLRDGFELVQDAGGVALADAVSGGALFADYDNDGDADLYVLNLGPNVLFRNDGGHFVDVTAEAGVGDLGKGESATFGDYDGDGWLDLYVVNWLCPECGKGPKGATSHDRLFHNQRDGTFLDVSELLDVELLNGAGFAASFFDLEGDGDLDLYVVNDKGWEGERTYPEPMNRNLLFRNEGRGCGGHCFTEIGRDVGADARVEGMGLAIDDYDADGDLDLAFSNTGSVLLLEQQDSGVFLEVARERGIDFTATGWGLVFFDFDNDARRDLYLAVGENFGDENPNRLFAGTDKGKFTDVSKVSRADDRRYSIGVATADYDKDGFLDLVVGDWAMGYRIYRNLGQLGGDSGWLRLRFQGGGPVNRDAVGTRAFVTTTDGRTQLQQVICGASIGSGHDLALHFGLGSAEFASVRVVWPNGVEQTLEALSPNREHHVAYPR